MSEEPRIILFFKPEYYLPSIGAAYIGLYTIDDVETKVFITLGNGLRIRLFPTSALSERGIMGDYSLLSCNYRIVNNEIHCRLVPGSQERLGIETIIFTRLETYDPVDPYYWFPHFFPRNEQEGDDEY